MVTILILVIIFTCKIIIEESQRKYGNHTLSQSKNTNINSFSKQDSTSEKYTNEIENNVLVKNKPSYYSERKVKDSSSLKSIYTNRDSITLQSIICVDTETTGKYSGRDEILQLAIIDGTGKILFNELIKPARRKRWPEAQEINGITPAMVKDKQPLLFYEHKLNAIFYSASVIVGYNLKFDLDFLKKGGIDGAYNEYDSHLYYDVMEKFAPIYGQYDVYHGDFRWKKLKTCARYYKYQWDGKPHDALADAKATLHCFMVMTGLKSLPAKTNKQSNKPSYQKVWKEYSENKTGKRLRFNDFNKIVELVEKWAELAGVKKDSISFSKVTDKSKILIKYNGSFLLEVRMPTTMNYIKMSDEMMKSVPPTSTQLNMLCFYSFEDLQLNHELKAYCIKKIRS